ncbi:MAG: hypothetical protein H0V00_02950 [Chloroflexia bacterium]|nr:hypothetical protein [Chloroflexia bacterium]
MIRFDAFQRAALMVADTLTVTDLAASLDEVLDRAHAGERIAIELDGEVIAIIGPPIPKEGTTWGEFLATYSNRPRPDDRFADDLEAILAEREMLGNGHEWPD